MNEDSQWQSLCTSGEISIDVDVDKYKVGKMVEVKNFDLMYNVECSTGIHFFWTKEEVESYTL